MGCVRGESGVERADDGSYVSLFLVTHNPRLAVLENRRFASQSNAEQSDLCHSQVL